MSVLDIFTNLFFRSASKAAIKALINALWLSDHYCPCVALMIVIASVLLCCFPTANLHVLKFFLFGVAELGAVWH